MQRRHPKGALILSGRPVPRRGSPSAIQQQFYPIFFWLLDFVLFPAPISVPLVLAVLQQSISDSLLSVASSDCDSINCAVSGQFAGIAGANLLLALENLAIGVNMIGKLPVLTRVIENHRSVGAERAHRYIFFIASCPMLYVIYVENSLFPILIGSLLTIIIWNAAYAYYARQVARRFAKWRYLLNVLISIVYGFALLILFSAYHYLSLLGP